MRTSMAILREGQRIRDTYVVERFLGEGAFAEVYRIEHRFLGRQAMKVLKAEGMTTDEIEGLLGEAVLLSRIGHPNIVRVFDANVLDVRGTHFGYFTMEYVAGGSLGDYWRSYQDRFMPVKEAVGILKQTCAGLSAAHAENPPIVHRDIKPQNILIGYDGAGLRVRLSDFGLAKRVNPLTLLASSRGTLSFKPPESLEDADSCAADVWALGTTLYLLLTDTLPHPHLSTRDVSSAERFLRPLRPAALYNITVDAALDGIISRCLARDPGERYPNAQSLLADLQSWSPSDPAHDSNHQSDTTKSAKHALGTPSPVDKVAAAAAVREALNKAREPGQLMSAADILEEALNKDPDLRERYEPQVKLWRRGVCM